MSEGVVVADPGAADLDLVRRYRQVAEAVDPPRLGRPLPKRYPGRRRVPLPWVPPHAAGRPDGALAVLGRTLLGFASVRYRHHAEDPDSTPGWTNLGRPVPSGGACHPSELYLCWPGSDDLAAGVYHYDPLHHAVTHLAEGEPSRTPALEQTAAPTFVASCRVWKNTYRYGNFGYRLGCLDLGTVVGQLLALNQGGRVSFLFDQLDWDRALRLHPEVESTYAVVHPVGSPPYPPPVGTDGLAGIDGPAGPAGVDGTDGPAAGGGVGAVHGLELDHELAALIRPETRALHQAAGTTRIPAAVATAPGRQLDSHRVAASAGDPGAAPLGRRTAWALRPAPLRLDEVTAVLSRAADVVVSDLPPDTGLDHPLSFYCVVTGVAGVAPGAYRYDVAGNTLVRCGVPDAPARLAAAVRRFNEPAALGVVNVFVAGAYQAGIRAAGPRWYRVLNMLAGVAVQRVYLAAEAGGLGARARLGFHVATVDELLGLPPEQTTLAQVALGRPAPRPGLVELMLV